VSGMKTIADRIVAVLGFHKVGRPPAGSWDSWFYVSEQAFATFLIELIESEWSVLDLRQFIDGLAVPDKLPARSVLLTFDDGYRSMRDVALPILRRFAMPGVLFVPTAFVGGWNTFDAGVEPDEPICGWDDLRVLARSGVSVQSHGVSHRRFSELGVHDHERELTDSRTTLEAQLGTPIDAIAFPYGDPGEADRQAALARLDYRAAFLYGGGPVAVPVPDRYRIPRIAMGPDTDLRAELRNVS